RRVGSGELNREGSRSSCSLNNRPVANQNPFSPITLIQIDLRTNLGDPICISRRWRYGVEPSGGAVRENTTAIGVVLGSCPARSIPSNADAICRPHICTGRINPESNPL